MKNVEKKVQILGTNYTIFFKTEEKEPRLAENWGFCDFVAKEIYIRDDINKETADSCHKLERFKSKVIRHEILHAFLCESGLKENSFKVNAWAENEEMVDWIAIQFPKLVKIYKELDILGDCDE